MKKLLVVLHLFYEDQLPYFLDKLGNIRNVDWDLLVTGSSISEDVAGRIREFKPDAKFLETGNAGYDIWPFIQAVRSVSLKDYDVVFKLHTKNRILDKRVSVAGQHYRGYEWRDKLVDSLLGSSQRFSEVIRLFDDNPDCGMVCSIELYTKMWAPEDCTSLNRELDRVGMNTRERRFCAGSMMAFRASVLENLAHFELREDMFGCGGKTRAGGTLAHVYERVLSLLAPSQGKNVLFVDRNKRTEARKRYREDIKPVLDSIFSLTRRGDHWEKYLKIFGITIKLDDGQENH